MKKLLHNIIQKNLPAGRHGPNPLWALFLAFADKGWGQITQTQNQVKTGQRSI